MRMMLTQHESRDFCHFQVTEDRIRLRGRRRSSPTRSPRVLHTTYYYLYTIHARMLGAVIFDQVEFSRR